MGKPTGFLEVERKGATKRPISDRINDYLEIELIPTPLELLIGINLGGTL